METLTRKERKKLRKKNKRVNKVRKEIKTDIDHLIARWNNGSEHWLNKKRVNILKHRAKHQIFDILLPHEQIIEQLRYNYNTLNTHTRDLMIEEIVGVIEYYMKWNEFYNKKCFKNDNPPKKI